MKRFFKIGVALVLAAVLMAPYCGKAFAAEKGTLYAADAEKENLSVEESGDGELAGRI